MPTDCDRLHCGDPIGPCDECPVALTSAQDGGRMRDMETATQGAATMTDTYAAALERGHKLGAGAADDAAAMALFCDAPLQTLCGAVSPQLVWEGAQASRLTLKDLGRMAAKDPMAVADLMWI